MSERKLRSGQKQGLTSGGLFRRTVGAAQICPVDVRAKLFAANRTVCDPLDRRAMICRNAANTGRPLRQQYRDDAK